MSEPVTPRVTQRATRPTSPPVTRPAAEPDPHSGSREAARRLVLGRFGEAYAARHLVEQGMVLLDRNWRCDAGEIDLVLREGRVLVVCEVKTRTSTAYGSPLEGVDGRKAARLRRLAARWLADHPLRPDEVRIDVVGVLVGTGRTPVLEHLRGIG
jgi:putative endonuclease